MAKDAILNIIFGANTKELDKALDGATKRLRDTAGKMNDLGKSLSIGLTAPIAAFGAIATKNAVDSAKAIAQVEAAVQSTGGAAGRSVAQLEEMAAGLQRISLYDDDQILKEVTANLLTFTNVTGTQFDKAQVAILNLSTRLGTDLTSASVQVGKALNDPIKGVTALGRAGVQFTAQQKELITTLAESGDVAGAQSIILGELETQFGGAAEAAANVDPYTQLANEVGNLSEDFGVIINEAIRPLVAYVRQAVDAIKGWSDETKTTVLVIGGLLAVLGPVLIAVSSLITAYTTIKGALIAARAAQIGLNLATLANPYVLAAAAVATLGVAIYNMNRRATDAATQVNKLAEAVDELSATEAIAEVNRAILEQTTKVRKLQETYDTLQKQRETGDQFDKRIASQRKQQVRDELANAQKTLQGYTDLLTAKRKDLEAEKQAAKAVQQTQQAQADLVVEIPKLEAVKEDYNQTLKDSLDDLYAEYQITGDLNKRIDQTAEAYKRAAIAAQRLGDVERAKELKALMQGQGAVAPLTPVAPGQIANPALQGRGLVVNPADAARTAEAAAYAEQLAAIDEIVVNLGQNMEAVGAQFGESLGMLITGAEGAEEALKATARAAIDAAFNAATALAIQAAGQTAVGSGPAAAIILPALITAGMGLIKSVFTNLVGLATGGLTTGPMLAMIGDNPSGKEAVIPFERMGEFLQMAGAGQSNANVTVTGRLQGRDLVISNERTTFNRNRTKY
jgi:hypothetical protein